MKQHCANGVHDNDNQASARIENLSAFEGGGAVLRRGDVYRSPPGFLLNADRLSLRLLLLPLSFHVKAILAWRSPRGGGHRLATPGFSLEASRAYPKQLLEQPVVVFPIMP